LTNTRVGVTLAHKDDHAQTSPEDWASLHLGDVMVARTAGRKGRPYRRDAANTRAHSSGVCSWCGHPVVKGEVDHRANRAEGGANNPANYQILHGSSDRCTDCGQACNQVKYWAERRQARTTPRAEYARW
jgi:hypothetical protein